MIPISLLVAHFIGDFLLQSDRMALNKSKSWEWLGLHVVLYSLCFMGWGIEFVILTFVTHFLTDAVTSQIMNRLWFMELAYSTDHNGVRYANGRFQYSPGNKRHWFFVTMGFDQLIHFVTLAATYAYVGSPPISWYLK